MNISKCSGVNCPIRTQCDRYDQYSSSHDLLTPPFSIVDGVFRCTMYWGAQQTSILDQLKKIAKGKI